RGLPRAPRRRPTPHTPFPPPCSTANSPPPRRPARHQTPPPPPPPAAPPRSTPPRRTSPARSSTRRSGRTLWLIIPFGLIALVGAALAIGAIILFVFDTGKDRGPGGLVPTAQASDGTLPADTLAHLKAI